MHPEMLRIQDCLAAVRARTSFVPEVAVVLGSGLGGFAESIRRVAAVEYTEIPGFPVSTAPGHAGRFIFGFVENTRVVCMQGRVHMYEGYDPADVVLPVRLMGAMGAKIFFVTNACGGMRPDLDAGKLMLITDQISCFVPNPLRGENLDELGVRFPDMTTVYDRELRDIVRASAEKNGVELKEGVYVQLPGPSYETPAEIRMLATLGADAVGMSTVVEVIAARHAGMRAVGVSCVANLAAGLSPTPLTGEEVIETANRTAPKFRRLLWDSIAAMHREETP
ncbi:MAG: purine-nucleoside phosphorylase [Oscillospiraceae bacterium]|nr:purine-nucleoside phosphorylase [Oscillospiraceae bacterium]